MANTGQLAPAFDPCFKVDFIDTVYGFTMPSNILVTANKLDILNLMLWKQILDVSIKLGSLFNQ